MKVEIKNKAQLYWLLQLSGWFLYTMFFFLIKKRADITLSRLYLFFIFYVIGFGLTVGLRYIYRHFYKNLKNALSLPFYIILFSVLTAIVWRGLDAMFSYPFWKEEYFSAWLKDYQEFNVLLLVKKHLVSTIFIGLWSSLYFGIKFWLDWQSQKDKAEIANSLAREAKLQMLRYQLNPHFLFNSLNSIRALIDEDGKVAKSMITELSEFLRYSLINENDSFKPLKNELEAIKHYFSIEKKRFEEKLEINFEIDKEAESFQVLSFLIQPFVENAIKYGMQTSPMPLKIEIVAKVIDRKLLLKIKNSGCWVDSSTGIYTSSQWKGTGKGLENVKMRLENAYGSNYRLEFIKAEAYVMAVLEIFDNT